MNDYFSDREFGPQTRVEGTIGNTVWQGILSLVETGL